MRSGPLVVLVEVRTRGSTSWESAFGSVSAKKRARLREAMERCWREMRSDATIERMRVDCAAVALGDPVTVEIAEAIV